MMLCDAFITAACITAAILGTMWAIDRLIVRAVLNEEVLGREIAG